MIDGDNLNLILAGNRHERWQCTQPLGVAPPQAVALYYRLVTCPRGLPLHHGVGMGRRTLFSECCRSRAAGECLAEVRSGRSTRYVVAEPAYRGCTPIKNGRSTRPARLLSFPTELFRTLAAQPGRAAIATNHKGTGQVALGRRAARFPIAILWYCSSISSSTKVQISSSRSTFSPRATPQFFQSGSSGRKCWEIPILGHQTPTIHVNSYGDRHVQTVVGLAPSRGSAAPSRAAIRWRENSACAWMHSSMLPDGGSIKSE
jgi:hypothetical protein